MLIMVFPTLLYQKPYHFLNPVNLSNARIFRIPAAAGTKFADTYSRSLRHYYHYAKAVYRAVPSIAHAFSRNLTSY